MPSFLSPRGAWSSVFLPRAAREGGNRQCLLSQGRLVRTSGAAVISSHLVTRSRAKAVLTTAVEYRG
jgi:hypothetical protein